VGPGVTLRRTPDYFEVAASGFAKASDFAEASSDKSSDKPTDRSPQGGDCNGFVFD
jgi:hypothetical protein